MLWVILTLMAVFAAVGLTIPLVRRLDARAGAVGETSDNLGVLKAQLGEIEAQAGNGVLETAEADALKSDLKRRVLAEGRRTEAAARPLSDRALLYIALGGVAVVTLAGTGLYLTLGRPDVKAAPATAPQTAARGPDGSPHDNPDTVIAQLESQMQQHPDNAEGWRMLGWSYLQTGRNEKAAEAYGKAAALDPKNADYLSAQAEATVLVAQGTVTPIAQGLFRKALAVDPADPRARYYLALAKDQSGDREGAMNDWVALIRSAPADAPWLPDVRGMVERVAAERKIDLSGRLPPAAASAGPAAAPAPRGPTPEQMAQAQSMSEGDRAQMIQGMVSGLAARLKQNPRDLAGWQQLMRARMVLGQTARAAADYKDARNAFAGSPAEQQALRQAAEQLGVPGT